MNSPWTLELFLLVSPCLLVEIYGRTSGPFLPWTLKELSAKEVDLAWPILSSFASLTYLSKDFRLLLTILKVSIGTG
jgi:hypothetical protein